MLALFQPHVIARSPLGWAWISRASEHPFFPSIFEIHEQVHIETITSTTRRVFVQLMMGVSWLACAINEKFLHLSKLASAWWTVPFTTHQLHSLAYCRGFKYTVPHNYEWYSGLKVKLLTLPPFTKIEECSCELWKQYANIFFLAMSYVFVAIPASQLI